jgi:hypothetical protein
MPEGLYWAARDPVWAKAHGEPDTEWEIVKISRYGEYSDLMLHGDDGEYFPNEEWLLFYGPLRPPDRGASPL